MQEVIKKIALAYERKKDQILSDTIYSLFHWHSPKQGYRTREEFESDKRYQELVNTRFLIENNKIDPENDIIIMPDGTLLMRFCWFYEKYFSEEIAILEKRKSSAQPSASNEAPDLQSLQRCNEYTDIYREWKGWQASGSYQDGITADCPLYKAV